MANILIGSARIGENGGITGGKAGDQKQTSITYDGVGEVAMQSFYVHPKGWYIIRHNDAAIAQRIAQNMIIACNNPNIGYNQNDRYGVVKYGVNTTVKTNSDCSSLVRECVKEATGKDPGDFNTSSEWQILSKMGCFTRISYVNQASTPIYDGDILVTKSKGHTVIVVSGNPRVGNTGTNTNTPNTSTTSAGAVTAKYSADKKDASLAGSYKVTTGLNLRDGAGTNFKSLTVIPSNTIVRNYGYYSKDLTGKKWLYIQFTNNNTKYTGFASEKYLLKQ